MEVAAPPSSSARLFRFLSNSLFSDASGQTKERQLSSQKNENRTRDPTVYQKKILLLGDCGTGKTTLVRRWSGKSYRTKYDQTIGIEVSTIHYAHSNMLEKEMELQFWDVSGAEIDNLSLIKMACDSVDGVFLVFNVNRLSTVAAIDKWRRRVSEHISCNDTPFVLLAHKADLIHDRIMSSDAIDRYCRAAGYRKWQWTVGRSSLGENVRSPAYIEALDYLIGEMLEVGESSKEDKKNISVFDTEVPVPTPTKVASMTAITTAPTKAITTLPREEFQDNTRCGFMEILEPKQSRSPSMPPAKEMSLHPFDARASWIFERRPYPCQNDPQSGSEVLFTVEDEEESDGGHDKERSASMPLPSLGSWVPPLDNRRFMSSTSSLEISADRLEQQLDSGWEHFAGTISRLQAEELLKKEGPGTFLLRRKDAKTLILSFQTRAYKVQHTLILFEHYRYMLASSVSKNAKASKPPGYSTLKKLLLSLRKIASNGLYFQQTPFDSYEQPGVYPVAPATSARSMSTSSRNWHIRRSSRDEGRQSYENSLLTVAVPNEATIRERSSEFYATLLKRLASIQENVPEELVLHFLQAATDEQTRLEKDLERETIQIERLWQQLIEDMGSWDRILQHLRIYQSNNSIIRNNAI